MASPLDDSPNDDLPAFFSGFRFFIHGFGTHIHDQLCDAIELRGGVTSDKNDTSCTHVVVSQQLPLDDAVCAAARRDGKILVTEFWVSDCLDAGEIVDTNYIVYRPVPDPEGIPGSKKLIVCLTGYQGQARRNIMRMVHLMGAHFCKPLVANKVTHLVCYKFEGEKFNLAKHLKIKLINHKWLEDSLKSWSILAEDDYLKSGLELELLEAEAKDSEDDERIQIKASTQELSSEMVAEKQEFVSTDLRGANHGHDSLETPIVPCANVLRVDLIDQTDFHAESMHIDSKDDAHLHDELHSITKLEDDSLPRIMEGQIKNTTGKAADDRKSSSLCLTPVECPSAKKYVRRTSNLERNYGPLTACQPFEDASSLQLNDSECCQPCRDNLQKDTDVQGSSCFGTTTKNELVHHIQVEKEDKDTVSVQHEIASFLKKVQIVEQSDFKRNGAGFLIPNDKTRSKNSRESMVSTVEAAIDNRHEECTESASSRTGNAISKKVTPVNSEINDGHVLHYELLENNDDLPNGSESVTPGEENELTGNRKRKSWQHDTLEGAGSENNLEYSEKVLPFPGFKSKRHSDTDSVSKINKDMKIDNSSAPLVKESNSDDRKKESLQRKCGKEIESSTPQRKAVDMGSNFKDSAYKTLDLIAVTMPLTKSHCSPTQFLQTVAAKENSHHAIMSDIQNQSEDPFHEKDKLLDLKPSGEIVRYNNENVTIPRSCRKPGDNQKGDKALTERKDATKSVRNGVPKKSKQQAKVESNLNDQKSDESVRKLQLKKGSRKVNAEPIKRVIKKHMSALIDKENAVVGDAHPSKTRDDAKDTNKTLVCYNRNLSTHKCFALSGRRQQTKPLQALIKKLGGKCCKDSHQWSYQTTHLVIAGQLRRTEKFFAAAAAGRWILREDYLKDSADAGVFLDEKKYEWCGSGMTEDGSISFEAPRKWREQRENSGCGALEGLRILLYGECIIPSLDTLKRAFKAGGADLLATSPPYTRFLVSGVDVAIVSPGTPRSDPWVQEFLNHHIACVTTDFFVDLVCKPTSSPDKHVLYDSQNAIAEVMARLKANQTAVKKTGGAEDPGVEEIRCSACGLSDRDDVMLLCGDGGNGCGIAMHIDCCKPPLAEVPANDWYCMQCTKSPMIEKKNEGTKKKRRS